MASNSVMFVGGPSSGKSNYLFRTWIAIEHGTGKLRKDGLPDELDYLHDGASQLLAGTFAPHTSRNVATTCEIPVSFIGGTASEKLIVPDVNGEVWNEVYERRQWPLAWDTLLDTRCGFVLFVRAGSPHNVKPLDWVTCERLYRDRAAARPDVRVPTQVYLVDWLQILRQLVTERSGSVRKPRLSVVVTAWDRVQTDAVPEAYIAREFPLFDQFIRADLHGFETRCFGVSVVGGDFSDATFRDEYLNKQPVASGYCITRRGQESTRHPDILEPLYWALGH